MTTSMSIRELTRKGKELSEYDDIDIEDRKSHEYKGVFVSAKYAEEVKRFLEEKLAKERQEKLERIMKYAGKGSIDPRFEGMSGSEIRKTIALGKDGQ